MNSLYYAHCKELITYQITTDKDSITKRNKRKLLYSHPLNSLSQILHHIQAMCSAPTREYTQCKITSCQVLGATSVPALNMNILGSWICIHDVHRKSQEIRSLITIKLFLKPVSEYSRVINLFVLTAIKTSHILLMVIFIGWFEYSPVLWAAVNSQREA